MAYYGRSKRLRRGKWENRMAIIGITMVVISLAVAVNAKGASLKQADLDYRQKEADLARQVQDEENRTRELEEYKIYVQTKQYAEEVAKEKLGLVNPDEILLKHRYFLSGLRILDKRRAFWYWKSVSADWRDFFVVGKTGSKKQIRCKLLYSQEIGGYGKIHGAAGKSF